MKSNKQTIAKIILGVLLIGTIFIIALFSNSVTAIEFRDSNDIVNIYLNDSSGNLNLARGNLTVGQTGFFGWLGSLANRITTLFVQDINVNGTLRLSNATAAYGAFRYNDDVSKLQYSNDNGTSWGDVGSGGLSLGFVNTTAALTADTSYDVDTSSASFNVTLPDSPDDGTQIRLIDVKGNFGANSLTVLAGGSDTIEGASSHNITTSNTVTNFFYDATNTRWTIQGDNEEASTQLHRAYIQRRGATTTTNVYTASRSATINWETLSNAHTMEFDSSHASLNIGLDIGTNQITITQAGTYEIEFSYGTNVGSASLNYALITDGTNILAGASSQASAGYTPYTHVQYVGELAAGTVLDFRMGGSADSSVPINNLRISVNQIPSSVITTQAQAAEYLSATLTSDTGMNANTKLVFNTDVESSGSSISDDGAGTYTLKAGKTYYLEGFVYIAGETGSGNSAFTWRDSTNTNLAGFSDTYIYTPSSGVSRGKLGTSKGYYTPSVDTDVYLGVSSGGTAGSQTAQAEWSYVRITVVTDGTYVAQFGGATASSNGTIGFIPAPQAGQQGSLLLGNGSWDSTIFVNGSNVGIGTTTPSVKLDIVLDDTDYGGIRFEGENFSATDGATRFLIKDKTGNTDWYLSANNDGSFSVHQGGAGDRLVITNTGEIGIGVSAPLSMTDHSANTIGAYRTAITDGNAMMHFAVNSGVSASQYFMLFSSNYAASRDTEYTFATDGSARTDSSWVGGGADYAEWFIAEGTIAESSLVGLNLETGKARVWREGDPLVGVQSVNPGFVGNNIEAENTDEDMIANGYALVGLVGQLDISSPVVESNGAVYTPDGKQFIGYRLSDGKVFLNRDGGAIQELKAENDALKVTLCDMGRSEWC